MISRVDGEHAEIGAALADIGGGALGCAEALDEAAAEDAAVALGYQESRVGLRDELGDFGVAGARAFQEMGFGDPAAGGFGTAISALDQRDERGYVGLNG